MREFTGALKDISSEKNVYIVGAGRQGRILGIYLNEQQIRWNGYVDCIAFESEIMDKRAITYSQISDFNAVYVISSDTHKESMMRELLNVGIEVDQIVYWKNIEVFQNIMNNTSVGHDMDKEEKRLKYFENLHANQRCFVIGNGPSLQIKDLEKLKGEITFASNSINLLYGETDWRPTYYATHESVYDTMQMNVERRWRDLTDNCEAAFTSIMSLAFQQRDVLNLDNLYFYRIINQLENDVIDFSDDCTKGVYANSTITYVLIQLAVYMGIKDIILIGVDNCYAVEKKDDGTIIRNDVQDSQELMLEECETMMEAAIKRGEYPVVDRRNAAYERAKEYAKRKGIMIRNATRGGQLEVFERVDFDSLKL